MNICVYAIRNKITGQTYIGSSISYESRIAQHLLDLTRRDSMVKKLQISFNMYGIEAFEFLKLEDKIESNQRNNKENYWIKFYNAIEAGFNTSKAATNYHPAPKYDVKAAMKRIRESLEE